MTVYGTVLAQAYTTRPSSAKAGGKRGGGPRTGESGCVCLGVMYFLSLAVLERVLCLVLEVTLSEDEVIIRMLLMLAALLLPCPACNQCDLHPRKQQATSWARGLQTACRKEKS
eukprot:gnl/TRDRNA2_/TRDRNA2_174475_c1_seq1.p1 gnl/TRDRNA2_/TRDRNA2_174475_c1~~gnl/TRDRNA2_/TRDRNA2_174475_c1_seq1.p1  ORF type:complete len:122 (+),score=5.83 gnl/TRDRNA2_/TRDRNA2_174475_c1_seq1:25-366(+)